MNPACRFLKADEKA
jgi:hypothetical protein